MKSKMALLLCAALVVPFAVGGCPTVTPTIFALTANDSGTTVDAAVGDRVLIFLAANPTTGYTWQQTAGDTTILDLVSDTFVPTSSAVVGGGGVEFFRYDVIATGSTTLTLSYVPPGGGEAAETFSVTVNAQ